MRYFSIIWVFLLASCAGKSEPVDISDVDLNNAYVIGWYVTYSDLCRTYNGSGADIKVIHAIKERFKWSDSFKRGYDYNRNYFAYDVVTGLEHCDKAKAVLNAVNNGETS